MTKDLLFRAALSVWGAVSIGLIGLLVGLAWGAALGLDVLIAGLVLALIAAVWGAIAFQLTPTGGVILDNKATVNYAVIAVHGWMGVLLILIALAVWLVLFVVG